MARVSFQSHGFMHSDLRWLVNFTLTLLIDHPEGKILFDTSALWTRRAAGPARGDDYFPY